MQIEQSTLVNMWYIPMYTAQWEQIIPGNSTKSPISNVCRTTSFCRLISSDILSYDSCKNKEGSGFNIQRNLSIPITLLTNHLFFTLYKYSFHTEITFMKTSHIFEQKRLRKVIVKKTTTVQCVYMYMHIFSRNTLCGVRSELPNK